MIKRKLATEATGSSSLNANIFVTSVFCITHTHTQLSKENELKYLGDVIIKSLFKQKLCSYHLAECG